MMYTITRGPSKLVTQRRTGPTQQLDNKINDLKHKPSPWTGLPAPRIVFSFKKHHRPAPARPADCLQDESFTSAHEQNVRFVHHAWQEVVQLEHSPEQAQEAVHYKENSPTPNMDKTHSLMAAILLAFLSSQAENGTHQDFVPIDLDEWWAQRFLANIDKLS